MYVPHVYDVMGYGAAVGAQTGRPRKVDGSRREAHNEWPAWRIWNIYKQTTIISINVNTTNEQQQRRQNNYYVRAAHFFRPQ